MVDSYSLRVLLENKLNPLKKAEADYLKTIELEENKVDVHPNLFFRLTAVLLPIIQVKVLSQLETLVQLFGDFFFRRNSKGFFSCSLLIVIHSIKTRR
jgi:hypothetical protein